MTSPVDPEIFDPTDLRWPTPSRPAPISRKVRRKKRRANIYPLRPVIVDITDFESGGRGVGRIDGKIIFVEYAIPGERVVAEITDEYDSFLEATAVRVLEASDDRVEAPCEYFGRCGGCQTQHITYERQLKLKTSIVRDALLRIGKIDPQIIDSTVNEMWGMDDPWGYRNHMRFTVRRSGDIGQMQRGSHRFFRIDECRIALPEINEILAATQERTKNTRQMAVRVSQATGEKMIQPELQWRPGKRSGRPNSCHSYYREILQVIRPGDGTDIAQANYRISPPAFFQVNTEQAERLASLVIQRSLETSPKTIIDAYSGVGTFSVLLAPFVRQVIAIEESAGANKDAEFNLQSHANVKRLTAKVEDALQTLVPSPDVMIIDPPRAGIDRSVTEAIIESGIERVMYVSCDPQTLARDLKLFVEGGFVIREIQPIDMFPQTQHIECVTTLTRD